MVVMVLGKIIKEIYLRSITKTLVSRTSFVDRIINISAIDIYKTTHGTILLDSNNTIIIYGPHRNHCSTWKVR
jgi:hypothetical protein